MLAQMLLCGDGVDQLAAGILGMAGHKADLVITGHGAEQVEQVGKIDLFGQALAVAVDVLAKQGDLFVTFSNQLLELGQDGGRFTAALTPAHVGHDAVGAEIIAAVHDGQPGAEAGIAADGHFLNDSVALLGLFEVALAAADALSQHGRQAVDAVHTEHEVYIRVALAQLFHNVGLLGHAAADADDQTRILLFQLFQRAYIAENALLGMFAHGAGVEKDEVGVFNVIAQAETDILQNALDLLAIVDILLAAVAAHIGQGRRIVKRGQHLGGGFIMGIGQFFQLCSP